MERGFGGVMMWALDLDDFTGHCGAGRYPLLRAVNVALGVSVSNHTLTLGFTMMPSVRPQPGRPQLPPPSRRRHGGKVVHRTRRPPAPSQRLTTSLPVISSTEHQLQHQQQEHEQERQQKSTVVALVSVTSETPTAQGRQLLRLRYSCLLEDTVTAPSVNSSNNRLDKFWSMQELEYNWQLEITGAGSRSEVLYMHAYIHT